MSESHWAMIEVLCDLEEGLSTWEMEFIESLSQRGQSYRLSDRQIEILERIYEEKT